MDAGFGQARLLLALKKGASQNAHCDGPFSIPAKTY